MENGWLRTILMEQGLETMLIWHIIYLVEFIEISGKNKKFIFEKINFLSCLLWINQNQKRKSK